MSLQKDPNVYGMVSKLCCKSGKILFEVRWRTVREVEVGFEMEKNCGFERLRNALTYNELAKFEKTFILKWFVIAGVKMNGIL